MTSELKLTIFIGTHLLLQMVIIKIGLGNGLYFIPMSIYMGQVMYYVYKEGDYGFYLHSMLISIMFCVIFFYQRANLLSLKTSWMSIADLVITSFLMIVFFSAIFLTVSICRSRAKNEHKPS